MSKVSMLERFAAQSLVEHDGELIFSKERFAELIVQECIDAVYDDGQDAEYYQDRIKRHFGVEE